jgi:hypothetical protein
LVNQPTTTTPIHTHPTLAHTQHHHDAQQQQHPQPITVPQPTSNTPPPLEYVDVYMDDFIAIAQPPRHLPLMNKLLHAVDAVSLDPPHSNRRNIVSNNNIQKGDTIFSTRKQLLGWDIDTITMSLTLPAHRFASLTSLLDSILAKKRASRRTWRRLLGSLRSTTPAIYGATHLFSILQYAMVDTTYPRLRITPLLKAVLRQWQHLLDLARRNPTPLHTLVPRPPSMWAACDASKQGLGGFWVVPPQQPSTTPQHFLWREPLPKHITEHLVTFQKPQGSLMNSDLELMALLITTILATNSTATQHPHILIASDNTPAVAWATKGSTTSIKAPAFLLHSLTTFRCTTPFTFKPIFTPGHTNKIADCCSRSFALSDAAFLHYMNETFPVQPSWKLAQLPSDLMSTMNSCALGKLPDVALITNVKMPTTPPGKYGYSSVSASTATQTSSTLPTPYPYCKSLPSVTDSGPLLPAGLQSALERWNKPFMPWARRSPHWDALTPDFLSQGN